MAAPVFLLVALFSMCRFAGDAGRAVPLKPAELQEAQQMRPDATPLDRLLASALLQTTQTKTYDPAYVKLDYPDGDVPLDRGVCADVVVRAFRAGGVDLQKEIHVDMKANFSKYPQKWGARRADSNIDHRRVANIMTWMDRRKKTLPVSRSAVDYQPGDVVAWELDNGLLHIGLVSGIQVEGASRYGIVHNIGQGARLEDVLFEWKIIGHYRYFE